ncbi:MAG: FAD-dependent oxidoreductase [Actinomycetota bacterium]|nr:FAD-dependent oxidoreductase [Actinomycetota bacterium]
MARIVVIGAGVAGLASAIAAARSGHHVTVIERDAPEPPKTPQEAPGWERRGIPHFLMPHAFLARGVKTLRNQAPDIYAGLLDAGAIELRLSDKMPPGPRTAEDEDLLFLGCRRPVIEWVLRRKAAAESGIEFRTGTVVQNLMWENPGHLVPRARGVLTQDDEIAADLVIEASGRSSSLNDWIIDGGGTACTEETSECGLVYYSRYYRFRSGRARPEGPWLFGPRAELGYMETGTFWGDNDTFSIVHTILPSDRDLRILRHPAAFTAALRTMPSFRELIDDDMVEPITPVGAMGQLRNTRRSFIKEERPVATGVLAVGDALAHTNPRYAWGLSLSLVHAFTLGKLLKRLGKDVETLALEFDVATRDDISAAYGAATATDAAREPYWTRKVDSIADPSDATLPLFLLWVLPMAGMRDSDIFRKAVRRLMFLDRPDELENDRATIDRGRQLVKDMIAENPPPPPGPSRDELLQTMRTAVGG